METMQEKFLYDLTNPQKSILMSEKFYGEPRIFTIPAWAMIKENIDFDLLQKAVNIEVKNNEAFRTRFIKVGEDVHQYYENYTPFDVDKITISGIEELEDYLRDITFDIYASIPVKFLMFDNENGFGGFACVLHHMIGDAWTLALYLEEILKIYQNMTHPNLYNKPRESSYKKFIDSEEQYLQSEKFKKDKEYWEDKFNTPSEILNFKSNSNIFKTDSLRKSFYLPSNISAYCKENKISLFSFFYAAISIYFSRISNSNEIVIGTPFLNRTNYEEKNTIGMFISTLPFRTNINPDETIASYIKEISITQLGALRHQKYPYEELQKYYTEKYGRANNLYDIMFSFQNAKTNTDIIKIDFESRWVFTRHQIESLVISLSDIDGTGTLIIDYDYISDIFSEKDITKIHNRILYIASQFMKSPEKAVKDIEIVTPDEQEKLLINFNNNNYSYDTHENIATLFSKKAKEIPNNIALAFDGKEMTYEELDKKSNFLAKSLIEKGVTRNTYVGVLFNRSFEMIISILGILKSGAAYMPINPEYPNDRISYMIQDSKCKFILTSEDLKINNTNITNIVINSYDLKIENEFNNINKPDDLAYVIYTSGSTGKPKGVMIRHYSIVNTLLWRKNTYHFDTTVNVLQIPSFSFDSSVEDIFTPLISGSKLVLINQKNSNFDINLIRELIIKHEINHMLVVPSFYNVILNELSNIMQKFKFMTVAGEGFSIELVKKHFRTLPNVELYNEYGPTENSVCTSYYKFSKDDDTVFIGTPVYNCKCYVLNNNLKLQPYDVKGELYVSGPGLAKGYIGRNDLTENRFIPNPFEENLLMYKTGDIVSINENGLMTFHERVDYQVKYNGFRINLGEIENAISTYTKNPNIVVLLKQEESSSSLVAYIETVNDIDVNDLKQNIKKFLPHYMIPKEINTVDKFPSTPNGKVDRKALSNMYFKPKDNIIIAPRNDVDKKILTAWKQVLKQENISIDDNIFELGGDSLSIISIQSLLFKNGISINSQALFEHPTIRSTSDYLANTSTIKSDDITNFLKPIKMTINDLDEKRKRPKCILLTGVTGFLGSHILAELMNKNPDITVYCIVRNKPNKSYNDRLKEILNHYFGEKYNLLIGDKIIPITGDLVRDNLGIDVTLYKTLINKIDTIINAASLVKHFGDYNLFYNSNVLSAKNIIKFAKEARATINHISTTSVSGNYLVKNNIEYNYTENDFYIGQNYKDNVYVRTKFEAENEMLKAQSEGVIVNIFRVGNLMQRISDGMFQINKFDNAYFKRIYGFIKLGKLPQNLSNQELEFTPIDSCAEAIVKLMTYSNKVFHLLNPNLVNIYDLTLILNKYEKNMKFISENEFNNFIRNEENNNYLENFITDLNNSTSLNYDTDIHINDELTRVFLKYNGFQWPKIDNDYLELFIKNILEVENEKE